MGATHCVIICFSYLRGFLSIYQPQRLWQLFKSAKMLKYIKFSISLLLLKKKKKKLLLLKQPLPRLWKVLWRAGLPSLLGCSWLLGSHFSIILQVPFASLLCWLVRLPLGLLYLFEAYFTYLSSFQRIEYVGGEFLWNCMSESVLIICDFFFPLSGSLWNLVFVPRVPNFITIYLDVDWFVSSVLGVICPYEVGSSWPLNLGEFFSIFLTDAFPPSIFSVVFF